MKHILTFFLALSALTSFAQSGPVLHNPIFYGPSMVGGSGNTQNNYPDHHLNANDKIALDNLLEQIHKTYRSAGKKYSVYSEMGSNAGAMIPDIKEYLAKKGYTCAGEGFGMSSRGNTNGISVYYGLPDGGGDPSQKEDSTIVFHFGIIQ